MNSKNTMFIKIMIHYIAVEPIFKSKDHFKYFSSYSDQSPFPVY